MKRWMNDPTVPNHNGNGFPHMNDPTVSDAMVDPSAFMGSPQFSPNPQQQQHQPQQPQHMSQQMPHQQPHPSQRQAMPNGIMRNQSPAPSPFTNNAYQTISVIPSKRPRPVDDGALSSPRPNPNLIPTSRSETPPQHGAAFGQFSQAAMAQPGAGQPGYPHLQPNGSAHATPSPVMSNQMRPGSVPQRVSTASPHPFSPGPPQFGAQPSPVPSEHGTPQPNQFVHGLSQAFNPALNPSPSPGPMPPQQIPQQMPQQMGQMPQQMGQPPNMHPLGIQPGMHPQARTPSIDQNAAYQQMRFQQQQQQQQQQQMQAGQRPMQHPGQMMNPQLAAQQAMGQGRGMMPKQPMPPNGQIPPGAMPQGAVRPQPGLQNPQPFMKGLQTFMHSRGLPLDLNPIIGDRQIPLVNLFHLVQSRGGYRSTTVQNMWPQVAAQLGFRPEQFAAATNGLRAIYEHNLYKFEEAYTMQKQQKHQQTAMHPGQHGPPRPMPPGGPMGQQRPMQPGQPYPQMPPGPPFRTPTKQGQQPQPPPGYPVMNGFDPRHASNVPNPAATPGHPQRRDSMASASDYGTPAGPQHHPAPSPAVTKRVIVPGPGSKPPEHYEPHEYKNKRLEHYGGIPEFDLLYVHWGNLISAVRPDIPRLQDLGNISIHALARSLQSGLHSEVRMALDTLTTLTSSEQVFLHMASCDDLLEVLIECGEEQLDFLVEHTSEVSDEIQLTPYEDVARACQLEVLGIRKEPVFGTVEHNLDRAVEKLIAIATILRNLSFPPNVAPRHPGQADWPPMHIYMEENRHILGGVHPLGEEFVIKFFCDVIRYLGTRTMLLRTHVSTLDFMKDVITLLSNIANYVPLPGREQAMCLLQFILAFAPAPSPTANSSMSGADDAIIFSPYEPTLHPYLPAALETLAKLFSQDDPNRAYFKMIFAMETQGPTPYDLLTRTFALAMSPIPDQTRTLQTPANAMVPPLIEHRKPFIMHGLLAGDILASLAPGPEVGLARAWLSSMSGFGHNIRHLITTLRDMHEPPGQRVDDKGGRKRQHPDRADVPLLICMAIALLRRLVEKSRDPNDAVASVPHGIVPSSEALLECLEMRSTDWSKKDGVLATLMAYARLDD